VGLIPLYYYFEYGREKNKNVASCELKVERQIFNGKAVPLNEFVEQICDKGSDIEILLNVSLFCIGFKYLPPTTAYSHT